MNDLKEKLEKRQNDLAHTHNTNDSVVGGFVDFVAGFNTLLPLVIALAEALEFGTAEDMWISDGEYDERFEYKYKDWYQDVQLEALTKLQQFADGGE